MSDGKAQAERKKRVLERTEDYLHAAKRMAIEVFGTDSAHGHAEVISRIAHIMATLDSAEVIAEATAKKED